MITRQDAIAILDSLEDYDAEKSHGIADRALIGVLRANGFDDVADAWIRARDRVGFWYA